MDKLYIRQGTLSQPPHGRILLTLGAVKYEPVFVHTLYMWHLLGAQESTPLVQTVSCCQPVVEISGLSL